jgi:hypothetical protein
LSMTERLRHEIALLLAEDDACADRSEARSLLRARLAASISEGLGRDRDGEAGTRDRARTGDCARMAVFLDRAVSPAERDAIVASLADDAVTRSELAAIAGTLVATLWFE